MNELIREELNLDYLASIDDAERLMGATQLEKMGIGYFDDGGFSNRIVDTELIRLKQEELICAYEQTQHDTVKTWILFFFMKAFIVNDNIKTLVLSNINPSCGHLLMALAYVSRNSSHFQEAKEKVKALYQHDDPEVRWRCALVLRSMPLSYTEDIEVVRSLALDRHYTARTYGVLALKKLGQLNPDDCAVLEKVISIDDGAAKTYAEELLASRKRS